MTIDEVMALAKDYACRSFIPGSGMQEAHDKLRAALEALAAPVQAQGDPVFYVHADGQRAMPPAVFAAWALTATAAHEYRPVYDHPPRADAEVERLDACIDAARAAQGDKT